MKDHRRILLLLALGLLGSVAAAQRPPAPAPAPPTSSSPGRSSGAASTNSQPSQPDPNAVVVLQGHVATNDNTAVPQDASVELVCNQKVRQQTYAATNGDFSMQLGQPAGSFLEADDDPASQPVSSIKAQATGTTPQNLTHCELRASAAGFRSNSVDLVEVLPSSGSVDVGTITIDRLAKVEGAKISAASYLIPTNARNAYEKGMRAERDGKLADAQKYFERAVNLHPKYTSAWFRLGTVLERQNEKDQARQAYLRASMTDTKYVPAYLALAALAYSAQDWSLVLRYTERVMELDPMSHSGIHGYVVELDEENPADAYFYNAVANYQLNHVDAAEKSALKAEQTYLRGKAPRLHLLLAEIFARKNDYAGAMSELQTYLELVPAAKDTPQVRELVARLEKLNRSTAENAKPVQNGLP